MSNEETVRRYARAVAEFDVEALDELRHPEWMAVWPQSGEIVRGSHADRQIMQKYPGGAPRLLPEGRLVGSQDRWAVSPMGGVYRVSGDGENWWGEWKVAYPDGRVYHTVILIELLDGKIHRETQYWAEPFEAPAWRAQYVERMEQPE